MVWPGRDRLTRIVEADETYLGGQKPRKRGRGAAGKALVLPAAQQDGSRIGRIRLHRVLDDSAHSLEAPVHECIEPGSVVRTYGWIGYSQLQGLGYEHHVIRQESNIDENLLRFVKRVVSLLERLLLDTYLGVVPVWDLNYYLDELTFRFDCRSFWSRAQLFYRILQQGAALDPLPASRIKPTHREP